MPTQKFRSTSLTRINDDDKEQQLLTKTICQVSVLTTSCVAPNNGGVARQTNDQREFSEAKTNSSWQLYIVQSVIVNYECRLKQCIG